MTKNELLLNMAIDAVNWGDCSDFEMIELITEGNYEKWIKKHYPELHIVQNKDEDEEESETDWEAICNLMQKEITALLKELKKPYESQIYKAKLEKKAQIAQEKKIKNFERLRFKAQEDYSKYHNKKVEIEPMYSITGNWHGILTINPEGIINNIFHMYYLIQPNDHSFYFSGDQYKKITILE